MSVAIFTKLGSDSCSRSLRFGEKSVVIRETHVAALSSELDGSVKVNCLFSLAVADELKESLELNGHLRNLIPDL